MARYSLTFREIWTEDRTRDKTVNRYFEAGSDKTAAEKAKQIIWNLRRDTQHEIEGALLSKEIQYIE